MRTASRSLVHPFLVACLAAGAARAAPQPFPLDAEGNVLVWLVAGPFGRAQPPAAEALAGGPPREGASLRDRKWEWAPAGAGGVVDLEAKWRRDDACAYAACVIDSPAAQRATLSVGSDDTVRVWLEGTLVHRHEGRRGLTRNQDTVSVGLGKGTTALLLECGEIVGDWSFQVRIVPEKEPVRTALDLEKERDPLEGLRIEPFPFMRGPRDRPVAVVLLSGFWLGGPGTLEVEIAAGESRTTSTFTAAPGQLSLAPQVPPVSEPTPAKARIAFEGETEGAREREISLELPPYRRFEIYLVQHTHTDIGYTADQPTVLREHLRFIDEALHLVDATRDYPPDARFKWVCEVNWGAELYLDHRPRIAVEKLKRAAHEGLIELTAAGLNMTDVATEEVIIRSLAPVARFRREGFEVVSAMQNDVNGFPWAMPRLMRDIGVRYFSNGINETRSVVPFAYPQALWWESPDGSALLTWRGPHYMGGNFLGLTADLPTAERKLGEYLGALAGRRYPHDVILVPLSGQFTDNAPPTANACEVVKAWNEKWTFPRLRTATLNEFFAALEAREGERIPRHRKAWCDWWADGIGAGADELAIVKRAQERLAVADTFFALAGLGLGAEGRRFREDLGRAYRTALLFDEHTYGAWNSISDPGSLRAKHGWLYKASFAAALGWQAASLEDAALSGLAWDVPTGEDPVLLVVNPLPWRRTCAFEAALPRSMTDPLAPFRLLAVEGGEELPYQVVGEDTLWLHVLLEARDVPGCGYRAWRLVRGTPGDAPAGFTAEGTRLSNGTVSIEVDARTGALAQIAIAGDVLSAPDASPHGFGQYVYERIVKAPGRSFLWPRHADVPFERTIPGRVEVRSGKEGPVASSILAAGTVAEGHTVECEVTVWRGGDWIDLTYTVCKPATTEAESVYIAFPWRADLLPLRAEVSGGLMQPGADQIPRSASDWHSIQDFVVAGGEDGAAVWVTHDAPLVQFGGINTGKYRDVVEVTSPLFYSWPMNNYWFTNFPAEQGGEFAFRYSVGRAADASAARRFARERTVKPRAMLLPPGRTGSLPPSEAGLLTGGPCLQSVKAAEDGNGFIVRLRNLRSSPREAKVAFSSFLGVKAVEGVDVLERPKKREHVLEGGTLTARLGPHAAADFRVVLGR